MRAILKYNDNYPKKRKLDASEKKEEQLRMGEEGRRTPCRSL